MNRNRWLAAAGIALVAVLVAGAFAVSSVFAGRDPNTIHDAGSLPRRISVCGRLWVRLSDPVTLAEARTKTGTNHAAVVATGPWAPCPAGPCTPTAQRGLCDMTVWVRVGEDAYVGYGIVGGP